MTSLSFHMAPWLALALVGSTMAQEWNYIVPAPGQPFAHPPLRAIALMDRKPADLKEKVVYQGKPRYAQLVYGRGRTAPVAVVVDEIKPGQVELYVDADRDRVITLRDRVAREKYGWRVSLKTVVHEGDNLLEFPRTIVLRYGRITKSLLVATCGYLEGKATLGNRTLTVRRCDGDANGLFADAQDRVWLDANQDGKWDPAQEEYLFTPILSLDNKRITVRGDALGKSLTLAALEGTGTLKLGLPANIKPEQVVAIQATFQSRDGVVVSVRNLDGEATVPPGEYRISSLTLSLSDPKKGSAWGYVFTDNGARKPRWHSLVRDGQLTIDPIGKVVFTIEGAPESTKDGETLHIRPGLYTGDGLLIERAYRGEQIQSFASAGGAIVSLVGLADRILESHTSGFA